MFEFTHIVYISLQLFRKMFNQFLDSHVSGSFKAFTLFVVNWLMSWFTRKNLAPKTAVFLTNKISVTSPLPRQLHRWPCHSLQCTDQLRDDLPDQIVCFFNIVQTAFVTLYRCTVLQRLFQQCKKTDVLVLGFVS